jgi:hypothetical protein
MWAPALPSTETRGKAADSVLSELGISPRGLVPPASLEYVSIVMSRISRRPRAKRNLSLSAAMAPHGTDNKCNIIIHHNQTK